ncbi:hypothetical protein E3P77_03360 [Wallemia ichthyophaga]|nr:hypothetical protein E3P91_03178 [Wallemia ichthyophaga]TIA88709.1 hypothetical protein E3P97_03386 [Wallemia ichthyophaga]TIA97557.1 hypothetical protein E3P96_03375 [Wallemia ichthyophaga]TIB29344.1 hypothetical protein E3P85_03211 [Wallemia ichthyophaga]TIB44779.1 hypothetical protein E3P82_03354 [Wallemia ichthyophaga]
MAYLLFNAGSNSNHQLSPIDEDFAEFKFVSSFESSCQISTGGNHTLILSNRRVYGAGLNDCNQLGLAGHSISTLTKLDWLSSLYPNHQTTRILASWSTSFFFLESNTLPPLLISVGDSGFGCRGVADVASTHPHTPINLPLHNHALIHANSSFRHIIVILRHLHTNTYNVFGWGASRKGQLSPANSGKPFLSTPHLLLSTQTPIFSARTGREHTILHSADGLIGWGSNTHGQLSLGAFTRVLDYGCTWRGTVVYDGHSLWSVGRTGASPNTPTSTPSNTPLLITTTPSITQLAVGSEHSLFTTSDNTVWSFGWNEHGNLGLGHTNDTHKPTATPFTATHLHAGNATSFILTCT